MLFASLPGRILACACALSALVCPAAAQGGFDAGKAPFAIALDGDPVPYARFFTTVTPGEALTVTLAQDAPEGAYELVQPEGGSVTFADGEAVWRAPDAAGEIRELSVRRAEGGEIALRVFILQPMSAMEGEYLNGYRIGEYPNEALRGLAAYEKPPGFVDLLILVHDRASLGTRKSLEKQLACLLIR